MDYKITIKIEHHKFGEVSRAWNVEDPYAEIMWNTETEKLLDRLKEDK